MAHQAFGRPTESHSLSLVSPIFSDATKGHPRMAIAAGLLSLAAAVAFVATSGRTAGMACVVDPGPLVFSPESNVNLTVTGDVACPVFARPGTARVDALNVAIPPQHGTLRPRGRTGVIYRPEHGFKGADAFAFSMQGASAFYKGAALVRVNVTDR